MNSIFLNPDERILYTLRQLYRSYGYLPYKVSKFEEYDLYVQNRNFLDCRQILTFSDTDGRLMALKPDVTLSIVKNTNPADRIHKVCYTENVYRAPHHDGFREIPQTGLECIGEVDLYAMSEVLMLAVQSLNTVSDCSLLDLSHMGILSGILTQANCSAETKSELTRAISAKNPHELARICQKAGMSEDTTALLQELVHLSGPLQQTLREASTLPLPPQSQSALDELNQLAALLELYGLSEQIRLDLSIINDMDYYNGVYFRGYVDGIPAAVLSGGRYDKLMQKMGRDCGAIGFAVYLDQLERFGREQTAYDTDALILYDDTSDLALVIRTARSWRDMGKTVRVQRSRGNLSCRQLIRVGKKEVSILETND